MSNSRAESSICSAATDAARFRVEHQVAHLQRFVGIVTGPAVQRTETGDQLVEIEGLEQVVVGTGLKACHPVRHGRPGGQNQDRRAHAGLAQLPADRDALHAGEHPVEEQHVIGGIAERCKVRRAPVGHDVDLPAHLDQGLFEEARQTGLVLRNQHLHGDTILV